MSIAQLVLENCFAINQRLDFIGEGDEGLCESLNENRVSHPMGWRGDLCRICKLQQQFPCNRGKAAQKELSLELVGQREKAFPVRLFKSHPTGSLGGVR